MNVIRFVFCHRKTDMAVMVLCLAAFSAVWIGSPS